MNETVSVVYCDETTCHSFEVPWHSQLTAAQALLDSGLADRVSLPQPLHVGVYGLRVEYPDQYVLSVGDRVEIYRPLLITPQQIRRNRAARHPVGRYRQGNQWRRRQQVNGPEQD